MASFSPPSLTVFYQGQVASGAKVYVYVSPGTTPFTTYSNAALTVPNAHPIVADANGQVTFFIPTTTAIRIDTYTAGGDFIRSLDPVYPVANATTGGGAAEGNIVAAATTDLGSTSLNLIAISGSTTITSFGTSASTSNPLYTCRLTGAPLLTHSAALLLPGGANIQGADGDSFIAEYLGSGNWKVLIYQKYSGSAVVSSPVLNDHISGFTPSSITGTNTTGSLTVSAGQCASSDASRYISKSTTTSWAVSNGNGINGYSGGTTLPNSSTIHFYACYGTTGTGIYAIPNSSFPLSSGSAPSGYQTAVRRIFSINTNGSGALLAVTSIEMGGGAILNYLATQVQDVLSSAIGTTASLLTLGSVPLGLKIQPVLRIHGGSNTNSMLLTSPDETDIAPTFTTTSPTWDVAEQSQYFPNPWTGIITTNTSGQIRARASGASTTISILTRGWIDYRRAA